ncbi:hypothetical protein THAOC_27617, partial [Thalassiosira oceanica]
GGLLGGNISTPFSKKPNDDSPSLILECDSPSTLTLTPGHVRGKFRFRRKERERERERERESIYFVRYGKG